VAFRRSFAGFRRLTPPVGEYTDMELRHRIAVTLFLLSVLSFAVWFAFVYTWQMPLDFSAD